MLLPPISPSGKTAAPGRDRGGERQEAESTVSQSDRQSEGRPAACRGGAAEPRPDRGRLPRALLVLLGILAGVAGVHAAEATEAGARLQEPSILESGRLRLAAPALGRLLRNPPPASWVGFDLSLRSEGARADAPSAWLDGALLPSRGLHHDLMKEFSPTGVSQRLLTRMQHEARRYRTGRVFDPSDTIDPIDSVAEEQRAREAERILTRSFNRTLDDQVEQALRTTLGLGGLFDFVEDLGAVGFRSRFPGPAAGAGEGPRAASDARFQGSVGLKIDAHPRVVFRTEFFRIHGRVEVPILDEPLRLSFERPLGARSRAALTGGLARHGQDWAALTLSIGF